MAYDIGSWEFQAAAATTTSTLTASLDGLLNKTVSSTLSVDGLLNLTVSSTFTADGLLNKTVSSTLTVDGLLLKTASAATSFDAAVAATFTAQTSLDASLLATVTKQASTDAFLRTSATAFDIGAWELLQAIAFTGATSPLNFDSILTATSASASVSLDAFIINTYTSTVDFDASLFFGSNVDIGAWEFTIPSKTVLFDAAISQANNAVTSFLDAELLKVRSGVATFGAELLQTFTKTPSFDGHLSKVGATQTTSLDSALFKTGVSATTSLDARLAVVVEKTAGFDAEVLASLNKQTFIDGIIFVEPKFLVTDFGAELLDDNILVSTSFDAVLNPVGPATGTASISMDAHFFQWRAAEDLVP